MYQTEQRIAQLEEENRMLKARLEQAESNTEYLTWQEDLEKLSLRQAILIQVLHIVQSSENLSEAMNESLAEIGNYTGVSRIHIFEKNAAGTTVSNTVEWCNDGMEPIIDTLQNIPVRLAQSWFDMFDAGKYVSASDSKMIAPELSELLIRSGVKSVVVFPLKSGSFNYGFIVFDECIFNREWDDHEVRLLKSLSEILSAVKRRFHTEQELLIERDRLKSIGDHFPNGVLFRWETNIETKEIRYTYLSEAWTKITGLDVQRSLDDIPYSLSNIFPEDLELVTDRMYKSAHLSENYHAEVRVNHPNGEMRWLQIAAHPHYVNKNLLVYDGFIFDVTARKNAEIELDKLILIQTILITVLHIVQSAKDLSQAMNESLAATGNYAGVSRVHIFEKSPDEYTISNTFEWCNDGIEPVLDLLQNIPTQISMSFFDMFDAGIYSADSDSQLLAPELSEMLIRFGVKSFVAFPLSLGADNYGFVVFDECTEKRKWDDNEVGLLKSFSQIITVTKHRFQSKESLRRSQQTMRTVLDNINANILVADFETMKVLFVNETLRKMVDEDVVGKDCWRVLMTGQSDVCDFCPKNYLHDSDKGVYRFEYHCEKFNKHMVVDAIITEWIDGRKVLLEVIFDITGRKEAELKLEKHHGELEKLNHRQHVLINILQIMQFPGDFQRAIDHALAQIGKCAGVSRAFIVEKNDGAKSVSITHQWCNVGIKPFFYTPKKISMNVAQRWFDLFEESDIRCFSDLNTLDAGTVQQLENNDVKSVAVIPLINYDGTHYGIIGFLDCIANREWNAEDIELLKSTSQIISISTQRYNAEENLLSLSRRQTILIKVLQVVQSAENHHQAMNEAIAEVGKYAQLCRVHVFEKSQDGKTYSCTYEWRDEYTTPIIHLCQKLPIEQGEPWFDLLSANQMICTSDIYSLTPEIYQMLEGQRVKAIVSLPLSIYGSPFGFINFTVCKEKVWEAKEVKLLVNISQIFTTVIRRRQVEKAMKLSQQTMRTVLDNINASILVTEYDSLKILFANDNFRQAAGENVEGMLCWQSQKSGLTAPCEHCPRAVLIDGNGIPARVHHREEYNPLTGRWHIIMSTAIKWINDQLAVMELATDITDIKLNEMELVRAREKAEESDNLKSAFLANMSHEIRTPLNAIVGFLNIIAAENMLPEREQDYFNIIKTNAAQLVQLINDIIDVAKIEARQMNISLVPVDINQLMNELHILFKTIMQTNDKRDVVLILDESGFVEDSRILADPTRLRQVLNNLINNAIKYTDEGYIRFGYRQPAPGKLEFVVEDTGAGIAPDQHEVIFERFRQAGKNFLGGTGLGLNIAQSLVHMMGGDIWVESAEGRGSTFYFTILFQSA